jgi:hypothetical protein
MSVNEATDVVTDEMLDSDTMLMLAGVAGGYAASMVGQSAAEGRLPYDMPNEAYGLLTMFIGYYMDMDHSDHVAVGGGLYTVDAMAQRFGLKNTVTSMGGN